MIKHNLFLFIYFLFFVDKFMWDAMVPQRSMPYTLNPPLNLSIKILLVTQWIDNKKYSEEFYSCRLEIWSIFFFKWCLIKADCWCGIDNESFDHRIFQRICFFFCLFLWWFNFVNLVGDSKIQDKITFDGLILYKIIDYECINLSIC